MCYIVLYRDFHGGASLVAFSQSSGGKCEKTAGKPTVGCAFGGSCYNDGEVITLDRQTFGAYIAEQRKRQGLTQQQLAQRLYVTDKAVSKWERGLSYPDVTLLQPLAAALQLRVDSLLPCRTGEREELLEHNITPPAAETAVQSVLDISRDNDGCRKRRQRLWAAAAVCAALVGLLAVLQHNGALFISRRTVTPDGVTLSVYRDALIGGHFRVETDAPLAMADTPCAFCGRSEVREVTRLALDDRLTAPDALLWSEDGRFLLLSGRTGGTSAWLEVWAFPADGTDAGIIRSDAATDVLLQLSGHGNESAPSTPLLPALPGVSEAAYLPRVALTAPRWLADGQLELAYAYDGTDGVHRSGTLVYDAARGVIRSVSGI